MYRVLITPLEFAEESLRDCDLEILDMESKIEQSIKSILHAQSRKDDLKGLRAEYVDQVRTLKEKSKIKESL